MFRRYFAFISAHLVREHNGMNRREERNLQMREGGGGGSEERKTGNENAQKAYDKLLTNTNTLAVSGVCVCDVYVCVCVSNTCCMFNEGCVERRYARVGGVQTAPTTAV